MMKILNFLFLIFYVVNATQVVTSKHKRDCSGHYNCPETPSTCPSGTHLGPRPENSCCQCCLKHGQCQNNNDCTGEYSCPEIPATCPSGTHLGPRPENSCCQCCLNTAGECQTISVCTGINCPETPATCPLGTSLGSDPSNNCCQCCLNAKNQCCRGVVFCPNQPTTCPKGSSLGPDPANACCQICVANDDSTLLSTTRSCANVHCPLEPTADSCPEGSTLRSNPASPCCQCCVSVSTRKCLKPMNCSQIACPLVMPSKCPRYSSYQTKACCGCCVNLWTQRCVWGGSSALEEPKKETAALAKTETINPCPKEACINLSANQICPKGTKWEKKPNPNNCGCPCCLNSTNECENPIACPLYPCPFIPAYRVLCPANSKWEAQPLANGCKACPCCWNKKSGKCVTPRATTTAALQP